MTKSIKVHVLLI